MQIAMSICRLCALCLMLCACEKPKDVVLGTLEWDRIALPAPLAEKIVQVHVREGQRVEAGQLLLVLDPSTTLAQLRALEASVVRQQAALAELRVGPRVEEIERARADLFAARADLVDREADYRRLVALGKKNYVAQADIDGALAATQNARAQVRSTQEQLLELERGNRVEDIEQGEAALAEARSQAQAQRVLLEKLNVRAPRAGLVDSIPFKLGDEAPIGGSLVVMLVGDTPYARVYVPQSLRRGVAVGRQARIVLDESTASASTDTAPKPVAYPGRVRVVRDEPSFTPYYALTGSDAARLSYIVEVQFAPGTGVDRLPAGLPLRVEFQAGIDSAAPLRQPSVLPGFERLDSSASHSPGPFDEYDDRQLPDALKPMKQPQEPDNVGK